MQTFLDPSKTFGLGQRDLTNHHNGVVLPKKHQSQQNIATSTNIGALSSEGTKSLKCPT